MNTYLKQLISVFIITAAGLGCFLLNGKYTSFIAALLLFIAGLFLLIKGGDWFVDGATSVAEKFHIPEMIIGATVVSIGTTLPEVMVSAQAAAKGVSSISYGNAIGSIICNVSLIAAITLAVKPGKVDRKPLIVPIVFFFLAALIYCYSAYFAGTYTRTVGIILLLIFVVYITILVISAVKGQKTSNETDVKSTEETEESKKPIWVSLILLVFGATTITFGANLLVDNGTIIAEYLHVPSTVIALVFVALGTSLPELVTAITSLAKGHGALSLGNIIGANLFNLVLVSGLAITINPFDVPAERTIGNINSSLIVDIPVSILVMLILSLPPLIKGKLYRWQGILLLATYIGFCTYQFIG